MPHAITLSDLSWATPDGHLLFSDINLRFGLERVGLVGRNGVGKTTLLKLITGELLPSTGTVSLSGRIGVLRQSVQVGDDETIADLFEARHALHVLSRAQAGMATLEELGDVDWMLEERIAEALAVVGLDTSPSHRFLRSRAGNAHGQRLPRRSTPCRISSFSTNRPTISTATAACSLSISWRSGAAERLWSAMIASFSRPSMPSSR